MSPTTPTGFSLDKSTFCLSLWCRYSSLTFFGTHTLCLYFSHFCFPPTCSCCRFVGLGWFSWLRNASWRKGTRRIRKFHRVLWGMHPDGIQTTVKTKGSYITESDNFTSLMPSPFSPSPPPTSSPSSLSSPSSSSSSSSSLSSSSSTSYHCRCCHHHHL